MMTLKRPLTSLIEKSWSMLLALTLNGAKNVGQFGKKCRDVDWAEDKMGETRWIGMGV